MIGLHFPWEEGSNMGYIKKEQNAFSRSPRKMAGSGGAGSGVEKGTS